MKYKIIPKTRKGSIAIFRALPLAIDESKREGASQRLRQASGNKLPSEFAEFVVDLAGSMDYKIIKAEPFDHFIITWTDERFTEESVAEFIKQQLLRHPARATKRDFIIQKEVEE